MEEFQSFQAKNLGRLLKAGVIWQYASTFVSLFYDIAFGIIIVRLLNPDDFGIFAAATAITNVLLLQVAFGWPSGLLRQKELKEPILSTVFWIMEGTALVLVTGLFAVTPFLSKFYNDGRLIYIYIFISFQFFLRPLNNINGTFLRWKMRYDTLSRITIVVNAVGSVVGLVLAFWGFGVYSLAVSGVVSSIFLTIAMMIFAPWKPSFVFAWGSVKSTFNFSWQLHINNTLNKLAMEIDSILTGKLLGMGLLGIYKKGFGLGRMPVDLLGTNLYEMNYTALCHLHDKRNELIEMFQKMLASLTFIIYGALTVLFVTAEAVVLTLYGSKWVDAVLPMKVMLIGSFAVIINMAYGSLIDAQGLVRNEMKVQCLNIIMTVVAVVVGARWGLVGVSVGICIKIFITLICLQGIISKNLCIRCVDIWNPIWPNLAASLFALSSSLGIISALGSVYNTKSFLHAVGMGSLCGIFYISSWLILANIYKQHITMAALYSELRLFLKRASSFHFIKG